MVVPGIATRERVVRLGVMREGVALDAVGLVVMLRRELQGRQQGARHESHGAGHVWDAVPVPVLVLVGVLWNFE